jgi:hypothetical protein
MSARRGDAPESARIIKRESRIRGSFFTGVIRVKKMTF